MKPLLQTAGQYVTNTAAKYFWYFYNTQAAIGVALKETRGLKSWKAKQLSRADKGFN